MRCEYWYEKGSQVVEIRYMNDGYVAIFISLEHRKHRWREYFISFGALMRARYLVHVKIIYIYIIHQFSIIEVHVNLNYIFFIFFFRSQRRTTWDWRGQIRPAPIWLHSTTYRVTHSSLRITIYYKCSNNQNPPTRFMRVKYLAGTQIPALFADADLPPSGIGNPISTYHTLNPLENDFS